jgi:hypothetical protein
MTERTGVTVSPRDLTHFAADLADAQLHTNDASRAIGRLDVLSTAGARGEAAGDASLAAAAAARPTSADHSPAPSGSAIEALTEAVQLRDAHRRATRDQVDYLTTVNATISGVARHADAAGRGHLAHDQAAAHALHRVATV